MFGADRLARIAWAFVGLGIVIRTIRFLLDFPLWPDEAYLAHNYLDRGYLDLLRATGLWAGCAAALPVGPKDRRHDLRFFRILAAAVSPSSARSPACCCFAIWPAGCCKASRG